MLQVKAIKTFAINAKELSQAERFYTQVLGSEVVRKGILSLRPRC